MKPSVLAVCFFSSEGPVGDNFQTLCRAFAKQTRLSVATSPLLRHRGFPGAEDVCYLDFPKQRPLSWLSPAQWGRLMKFARRQPYDLLFLYSEHPLHAAVLKVATARRSLFWCLDPVPHSGSVAPLVMAYELAKRSMIRNADKVVVACNRLMKDVTGRYAIPPARVISSFHGVLDNLVFPFDPAPPRDIDILFFGRLAQYKGVDVLLDAVRALEGRGLKLKVVIAGPGAFPVPTTTGVTVINRYVDDRELATLVARARVAALPYRDATGSQVPQTAFAYGTPVVASSVGCLAEYVEDGVTGLLVPPGDAALLAAALERVLTDSALWNSLSAAATERARTTFSNERLSARLLEEALKSEQ